MNEMSLHHAVHHGVNRINQSGLFFKPDVEKLIADLSLSTGTSGTLALVPSKTHPIVSRNGYELITLSQPRLPSLDITGDELLGCVKSHYGLTAATVFTGAASIPLSKILLGRPVIGNASKYTNLVSELGTRFFPMATLPHKSFAAKVAKNTFGTIRVFGIVGRAMPFVAVGLAVYDVISIGMCVYEKSNER